MKLLLLPCLGSMILSGCRASSAGIESIDLGQPQKGDIKLPAYADTHKSLPTSMRSEKHKKIPLPSKYKKNVKDFPKKWKSDMKHDGGDARPYRIRREISDNQVDGDFARVLDRVITLTAPKARSRLQTLWKRLRSVLFNTKGDGANGERADELTKALFQQLFKQFDLPSALRKRADKLRRRVGPGGPVQSSNSTENVKADESVRMVDFRKKGEEAKNGDKQIQQWVGMVADGDKKIALGETVDVESATSSTTTVAPTTSTRYPQLSLFQRRKGAVQVSVKVPQKHAKSGVKRFSPAQA